MPTRDPPAPVVLIAEELAPSVLAVLGTDVEIRHVDGADRPARRSAGPTGRLMAVTVDGPVGAELLEVIAGRIGATDARAVDLTTP